MEQIGFGVLVAEDFVGKAFDGGQRRVEVSGMMGGIGEIELRRHRVHSGLLYIVMHFYQCEIDKINGGEIDIRQW